MVMKYSTLKLNKLIQRYENTEQCAMCLEGETVNRRKPLKYRSKARSENETLESVTVTTTKNLRQNRARKNESRRRKEISNQESLCRHEEIQNGAKLSTIFDREGERPKKIEILTGHPTRR